MSGMYPPGPQSTWPAQAMAKANERGWDAKKKDWCSYIDGCNGDAREAFLLGYWSSCRKWRPAEMARFSQ